jgi:hypothetical protein
MSMDTYICMNFLHMSKVCNVLALPMHTPPGPELPVEECSC